MRRLLLPLLAASLAMASEVLTGAGATLPSPLYEKWLASFQEGHPGLAIRYDPVGSGEGLHRLKAGQADFAASDIPLSEAERAAFGFPVASLPTVVGAVVAIYNLPGVDSDIKLTPEALAGIFLGRITRWSDPQIKAANRSIKLPDQAIITIHREDRSGTTFALAMYLAGFSEEWKQSAGSEGIVKWPAGTGVESSDAMQTKVSSLPYSIGYIEFFYAVKNHMNYALLRNGSGKFVQPTTASIHEASVDPQSPNAYPIPAETFLIVPVRMANAEKSARLTAFLDWVFASGQNEASSMGFIPLPPQELEEARKRVESLKTRLSSP